VLPSDRSRHSLFDTTGGAAGGHPPRKEGRARSGDVSPCPTSPASTPAHARLSDRHSRLSPVCIPLSAPSAVRRLLRPDPFHSLTATGHGATAAPVQHHRAHQRRPTHPRGLPPRPVAGRQSAALNRKRAAHPTMAPWGRDGAATAAESGRVGWCGWSGRGVAGAHAVPDIGGPGQNAGQGRREGAVCERSQSCGGGGERETAAPWGRRGVGSVDAHWLRWWDRRVGRRRAVRWAGSRWISDVDPCIDPRLVRAAARLWRWVNSTAFDPWGQLLVLALINTVYNFGGCEWQWPPDIVWVEFYRMIPSPFRVLTRPQVTATSPCCGAIFFV